MSCLISGNSLLYLGTRIVTRRRHVATTPSNRCLTFAIGGSKSSIVHLLHSTTRWLLVFKVLNDDKVIWVWEPSAMLSHISNDDQSVHRESLRQCRAPAICKQIADTPNPQGKKTLLDRRLPNSCQKIRTFGNETPNLLFHMMLGTCPSNVLDLGRGAPMRGEKVALD